MKCRRFEIFEKLNVMAIMIVFIIPFIYYNDHIKTVDTT